MSITYELSNFPGKNQLTEPVGDGQPDGDRNYECVPTSIASGLQYLTGRVYDGDQVRDAVYGPNWQGGTAPSAYVAYCKAQGVDLVAFNGSQDALVAEIHTQLHQGHPVLVTMPSQWGTPPPDPVHPAGSTHVGIMYGDGPGDLLCMNPWIWPTPHEGSDAYWAARLCFGQVWVMSNVTQGGNPPMLDINTVGNFFYLATNGKWHCKQTAREIGGGILLYYQQVAGSELLGQLGPGLPLTGEIPLTISGKNVAIQIFERGAIVYDPARVYDAPPGVSGDCYLAHVNNGTVLAWLESALTQQLTAANSALAQAKSDLTSAQAAETAAQTAATNAEAAQATAEAAEAQAKADLAAAQTQVATLTQQLAQLQAESGPAMTLADAVLAVVNAQGQKPAAA